MKLDERLSKGLADAVDRSPLVRKIADISATQLLWLLFGMYGFACYILWRAFGEARSLPLVLALVVPWIVTIVLEYAIRRRRPFQQDGKKLSIGMLWVPPSFPSGHATLAFSMAFALRTFGDPAVVWTAFVLAILISFGRIAVRVHYVSDVLAGAAVGFLVTSLIL